MDPCTGRTVLPDPVGVLGGVEASGTADTARGLLRRRAGLEASGKLTRDYTGVLAPALEAASAGAAASGCCWSSPATSTGWRAAQCGRT